MLDFLLMHPREQLILLMDRIYSYGMTTTSGGNLSVLDEDGDVWITPSGVDKGTLRPADIMRVRKDGGIEGLHKPSVEYPFHLAIYKRRPDVRAVLHAHPPALVAFSVVRSTPDTRVIPTARHVCGKVGYAPYEVPGSQALGDRIADKFAEGCDSVMLENHGVVTAGADLIQAFQRFETLDFCARLIVRAAALGGARPLTDAQFALFGRKRADIPEFVPERRSSREKELRHAVCKFLHRAYDHQLVTSGEGTFSARIDETSFLITPYGVDRKYLEPSDLIVIRDGKREAGSSPSRSVALHIRLYEKHPKLGAVMIAHPPNAMAFGVSDAKLDTRTIPESYLVLREIPRLPYGSPFLDIETLAETISSATPVVMIENDCLISTGASLLQAYDRLEVAEYGAQAVIAAKSIGPIRPISDAQVEELKRAFGG